MSETDSHHGHDESPVLMFIISMVILLIVSLIFGLTPLLSKTFRINKTALALGNTFSAGIFLTLALLIFLPEANTLTNHYVKSHEDEHAGEHAGEEEKDPFPFAFLICILSYFVLMTADKYSKLQSK